MTTAAPTVSRRTRPPASRTSLQWVIQIIGELLITAGLILLLFVAWQLWWTNIDANRTQQQAVDSLIQEFNSSSGNGGSNPAAAGQGADAEGAASESVVPDYDPANPPVATPPAYGQAYGVVYIPSLGQNYARPLAEGVGTDVLDTLGLGRYPSSQMPGEYGNFALAGHRQTNGAVLDNIDLLHNGDNIYVRTAEGYYTYRVYEHKIVLPTQVEVIAPNPDQPEAPLADADRRLLTLTSCHPRYGDTERYIVHAEFVSWQPAEAGAPEEIAAIAG
ncbi:MAG TPA: class E sortase [Candidatus Rothia avicola]|uniref:Class E sortase n=1 Tax=Candidatus Rothia avicola TaxID=2840478 RepID=A0A9D2CR62_9MICC|nr:class E sortase [Candidatus Rothia avicola]